MASDFMEVHKKIYEECRKKMDNGSDWLKGMFNNNKNNKNDDNNNDENNNDDKNE